MGIGFTLPTVNTKFVDPNTGLVAREWYLALSNILQAIGGPTVTPGVTVVGGKSGNLTEYFIGPDDNLIEDQIIIPGPAGSMGQSGSIGPGFMADDAPQEDVQLSFQYPDRGPANLSNLTLSQFLSLPVPISITSTTYSQTIFNPTLIFNLAAACTVTMLSAVAFPGMICIFKNISAFAVTSSSSNIVPIGSSVAGNSILPATAGSSIILQSDGTNWVVLH